MQITRPAISDRFTLRSSAGTRQLQTTLKRYHSIISSTTTEDYSNIYAIFLSAKRWNLRGVRAIKFSSACILQMEIEVEKRDKSRLSAPVSKAIVSPTSLFCLTNQHEFNAWSRVAPTNCLTKNGNQGKRKTYDERRLKRKTKSKIDERQNSKATDFQLDFFPCFSERHIFICHCFTCYCFMSLSNRRTNILVG